MKNTMKNTMKTWEKLWILLARLCGATIFKRYWPVDGSIWKNTHLNKNNDEELKSLINDSWEYTRTHANSIAIETIIMTVSYFSSYMTTTQIYGFIPIMIIIHGYAVLVHVYNRILAKEQLLVNSRNRKDVVQAPAELLAIRKPDKWNIGYHITYQHREFGPQFEKESSAISFRNYIYEHWGKNQFDYEEKIFLGEVVETYMAWKSTF